MSLPGRHWLATPGRAAWERVLRARPELAEPLLAGWAARGWPLVRRRLLCTDPQDELPLGLPLPPSHGKRRIGLSLPLADVHDHRPPPLLADCRAVAPSPWQPTIDALLALDPQTRCFGSLAWAQLTGLPYLSATSDLDLLWPLPPAAQREEFHAALTRIAASAPMRLDGEVTGPRGAVQWRELARPEVAVKGETGIMLMKLAEFFNAAAA